MPYNYLVSGTCPFENVIVRIHKVDVIIVVVQWLNCVWLSAMPWSAAYQYSLSFTVSWSLLKLMSIELMMPSNHLIFYHPLLLPSVLSSIRVFPSESALCIRWPRYWSFSFSISPPSEYLGLMSFRTDWFDLLAVLGTLTSLFITTVQKLSIPWCSAFFTVQLSHLYLTTGETIALTRRTFVGKVMSLLYNMLSRLVITFLPRSKHLLIPWLHSPSAVILEPRKIKSATVSPSICHEWITTNCGKFFKRSEYQTTWPASWEICVQFRKQQLGLDMEQQIGSK